MKQILCTFALILALPSSKAEEWVKHEVFSGHRCNTAVGLHANSDSLLDVVASFSGRVSLFLAPDWQEVVLHRFSVGGGGCIHSAVIDADGDGDLDWAGALAHDHPFWLENPGVEEASRGAWAARQIDPEITGMHCLLTGDVDNDGKDDLIINNFQPDKGLFDSMAWFSTPKNAKKAERWPRHIFADKDARGGSHYMGLGDIDGDGWKEIAVGAKGAPFEDGNWFAYWKNPGKAGVGGAWQKKVLATEQEGATNIIPADVDGDGKADFIATRGHGVGVVWMRNPDWEMIDIDTEIASPHSLTVADHDSDGDLDAAACGFDSKTVRWYENTGGKFVIHKLDEDQESYDLRSCDMDGDGDLDLLNAGRGSANVVWYENPLK
ncbi:MAG: VCBS repeat-containing protein [Verrucomicrobiota bacterium]